MIMVVDQSCASEMKLNMVAFRGASPGMKLTSLSENSEKHDSISV